MFCINLLILIRNTQPITWSDRGRRRTLLISHAGHTMLMSSFLSSLAAVMQNNSSSEAKAVDDTVAIRIGLFGIIIGCGAILLGFDSGQNTRQTIVSGKHFQTINPIPTAGTYLFGFGLTTFVPVVSFFSTRASPIIPVHIRGAREGRESITFTI